MGYIIIDLEFNNLKNITQYYKNFEEEYGSFTDIDLNNEIIEIGAVKVDKYMKIIGKMKAYIKPTVFPVINPKVNEITKIEMKTLNDEGVSFEEAINKLKSMFEEGDVLCSWAKDDIVELIINAHYHKYTDIKWLNSYLDIQEYATNVLAHKKALGLKSALTELKIKVDDSRLHDALNDAEYTVEVLKRIYNSRILKNYIIKDIYNMPAINVTNLDEIEIDEEKLKLQCPKCKGKIKIERPIQLFNWRFISIGCCSKCKSKILLEVLIKRTLLGEVVYKELESIINEETYLNYNYKLDNLGAEKDKLLKK